MTVLAWIGGAALGGAGALLRFYVDGAIALRLGRDFPFGTLLVNLTGAFALGVTVGLVLGGDRQVLLGTALLGSYTTFSTWMLETHRLVEDRETGDVAANLVVSVVAGLAAAALGRALGGGL